MPFPYRDYMMRKRQCRVLIEETAVPCPYRDYMCQLNNTLKQILGDEIAHRQTSW